MGTEHCDCLARDWRALRLALGLTQAQMAGIMGMGERMWRYYEELPHRCMPRDKHMLLRVYLAFPQARARLRRAGFALREPDALPSTAGTAAPVP